MDHMGDQVYTWAGHNFALYRSSYQNDPIRSLLELILFIFAVRTILQNRTRARGTSHFIQFSEDVSTCELTR